MDWDQLKDIYNDIEPFIWYVVAAVLWWRYWSVAGVRQPLVALLASLVIFGTSDFFETEAWWTPWWLLTWKVVGGVAVVVSGYLLWRKMKAVARTGAEG